MTDPLPLAFLIFLLVVLITLAVLYWIDRTMQQRVDQELKDLRLALRHFQGERKAAEVSAQAYSGRDPEPYRSAATGLREKLAALRRRTEQAERGLIELHERMARMRLNRWRTLFGAPFLWPNLRRQIAWLATEADRLQEDLQEVGNLQMGLERLPWQAAQQLRDLRGRAQKANQILGALSGYGLQGDSFQSAIRLEREIQTSLAQTREEFYSSDEATILKTADKTDTARMYSLAQVNRPRLADLLGQLHHWETDFQAADQRVAAMRKALAELDLIFLNLPPGLDADEEKATRERLEEIARNLVNTTARMEVESIPLVAQEAQRVESAAQELARQIQTASRELSDLDVSLKELANGFRELSLQMAALGARQDLPLQWDHSLTQLAQLNRRANSLGNARQKRTPGEVSKDLAEARVISAGQKEIESHVQELDASHFQLRSLLESPDFVQLPNAIQEMRELLRQAQTYSNENWARADDLPDLVNGIEIIAEMADRLVPGTRSMTVSELDLPDRLAQTRQLGDDYQRFAARVENVHRRLEDLQASEEHAQQRLEDLQKNLNQVQLIVKSNQYLAGVAASEIERLLHNVADLIQALSRPERGSVDKKARQATALSERVEAGANRWLDLLNKETQTLRKELGQTLNELEAIARLEDASVAEARRLLASEQAYAGAPAGGRARFGLADLILEFKRRSSYWQECLAAQNALENVQQLIDTYAETAYQREQAMEIFNSLAGREAQKRAWPPASVDLERERQDLEKLEADWQATKTRSGKAITLVAHFGSLSSRYQNLAERVRQNLALRQTEQRQVEQLEEELAGLAEPWETLLNQYQENPVVSQEIRGLLQDLDQTLARLERDYLRGGLNYEDVMRELKSNQRKVRYYQAALDDDHALDASGRVIRRRA